MTKNTKNPIIIYSVAYKFYKGLTLDLESPVYMFQGLSQLEPILPSNQHLLPSPPSKYRGILVYTFGLKKYYIVLHCITK